MEFQVCVPSTITQQVVRLRQLCVRSLGRIVSELLRAAEVEAGTMRGKNRCLFLGFKRKQYLGAVNCIIPIRLNPQYHSRTCTGRYRFIRT